MGTREGPELGYSAEELDRWAARAKAWASGSTPEGLEFAGAPRSDRRPRDVYLYVISGHKVRNPAAAMALIERTAHGR
jgi:uncharacterized protein YecE (DUF72 family)